MFLELILWNSFSSIIFWRKSYLMKSIQEHLSFIFQTVPISKMLQLSLCIYVFFRYFKQSANKPSPKCKSRCYILPQLELTCQAFTLIIEMGPDLLVC